MKKVILFVILSLVGIFSIEAQKMVVPGRTWWYWSATKYDPKIGDWIWVNLGLTLGQEEERSEKGLPCYAINPQKERVIGEPLAWLSEENDVVTVAPNFDLSKYSADNPSNEVIILSTFLGYWYGNSLEQLGWDSGYDDLVWNKDPEQNEFLLYDFSYELGDIYNWPWSGEFLNFPDIEDLILNNDLGGLKIISINDESLDLFEGEQRQVKAFNLKQEGSSFGRAKIIEGIGTVYIKGYLESFLPGYEAWYGFFIAPNSIGAEALSGSFFTPMEPILYLVEEADGTVLYVEMETYQQASSPTIKDKLTSPDSSLYDLYGRKIQSPLPGSIYIQDGKKYIGR